MASTPARSSQSRTPLVVTAAAIGAALVLPFALLEVRYQGLAWRRASDYAMLFGLLWLLPVMFVLAAAPIARALRPRQPALPRPTALVLRVGLLVVVTAMWIGLVDDQLPCLLGVPNCD
jgi:hypothetical protein